MQGAELEPVGGLRTPFCVRLDCPLPLSPPQRPSASKTTAVYTQGPAIFIFWQHKSTVHNHHVQIRKGPAYYTLSSTSHQVRGPLLSGFGNRQQPPSTTFLLSIPPLPTAPAQPQLRLQIHPYPHSQTAKSNLERTYRSAIYAALFHINYADDAHPFVLSLGRRPVQRQQGHKVRMAVPAASDERQASPAAYLRALRSITPPPLYLEWACTARAHREHSAWASSVSGSAFREPGPETFRSQTTAQIQNIKGLSTLLP